MASTRLLHFTLVTARPFGYETPNPSRTVPRRYNVTDSVRDALETLVKHASNQNKRIRHLEDALSKNDSVSARTQEKFGSQIDKVQEEMESVRACAVDTNIQSDDLRHRVQHLELKLFGTSVDVGHAASLTELGGGGRRAGSPHCRSHAGLAVVDRLDQLDQDVQGVTQVANKAKDEFEASNACMYEMEQRLDERLVEIRTDVRLATGACRQQALSEAVRTSKLQLDSLHDRLITRLQGVEQQQQRELAAAAQQSETRLREVEGELVSRVKAVSQLLDHTAKAGSQTMTHVAQLEATTQADMAGLAATVEKLAEEKVDATGMDSYTQQITKLFEESARQVRKEALHHADHLNQKLQQQLEAGLDSKADATAVGREGQSSRKQLTDLWAEAEAAREGLDQLKGSWQQLQGQVQALHDKTAATQDKVREVEEGMSQAESGAASTTAALDLEAARRREMEQQVEHLAGGVAVIKETLFGPVPTSSRPSSPSQAPHSRSASPTRIGDAPGALLASHGALVGRLEAVTEQVGSLHSSLRHKADKSALQEAKHELQEVRQQGGANTQALADLQQGMRQQGQGHSTALHRLEALIATCAQERATISEVRHWLDEATQQGRADMADRVGTIAAALQRLSDEVQEERAQAAEVASDYTPHQLQRMVERGTEGLLAVQRQVAAVQASGEEGVQQCSAEMRGRLEDLHRNHHRHQDLIQVTGEQVQQVLQEVRGRITPEEGRALVSRALRDRDQADSNKWQGLVHRFTSAFEETKRELEALTSDMDASFSLQLATKLSSEELPQKLQEANLVSRAALQAHVKQMQVLEESETHAIEAEADLNHLRKAISKKADRETVEADLDRIHKALRCKANVHAMSEALSQKLDIHSFLTASASATKIPAFDPKTEVGPAKEGRGALTGRPGSAKQPLRHAVSARP
ncbi:hypothetical protein ABBQ32_008144 [Trebouxia sp. C0010 RCD-2024]